MKKSLSDRDMTDLKLAYEGVLAARDAEEEYNRVRHLAYIAAYAKSVVDASHRELMRKISEAP